MTTVLRCASLAISQSHPCIPEAAALRIVKGALPCAYKTFLRVRRRHFATASLLELREWFGADQYEGEVAA
jgi:hypothetical protein